jgi:hypothetical protein
MESGFSLRLSRSFAGSPRVHIGSNMISDAAIDVFKNASIQPRFLSLTREDVANLESLAAEVKKILDRGVARDETPEWLKPSTSGNGTAK